MDEKQIDLVRFEISKLELKENDLLVFKYTGDTMPKQEDVECLMESLNAILPKGITALITGGEFEIYVARKEE